MCLLLLVYFRLKCNNTGCSLSPSLSPPSPPLSLSLSLFLSPSLPLSSLPPPLSLPPVDIFGTELASQFDCQREKGPPVVLKCIEMIEDKGTTRQYK